MRISAKQVCGFFFFNSKLEGLGSDFLNVGWLSVTDFVAYTVTDAERNQFRDKFFYSEQELAAAKAREKMLQEQLLVEINNSQERYSQKLQSCQELEVVYLFYGIC